MHESEIVVQGKNPFKLVKFEERAEVALCELEYVEALVKLLLFEPGI